MIAEDQSNSSIDIDIQALGASNVSNKISADSSSKGMLIFKDETKRLAFGIELYELEYNKITKRLKMKLVDEAFKVREAGDKKIDRTHKVLRPAIIGESVNPFIEIN
jgi:hypothetical protein